MNPGALTTSGAQAVAVSGRILNGPIGAGAEAIVATAWDTVRGGHPCSVIVQGEGGIGKTRLSEDFLRWLQSRPEPLVVLRARAHEAERDLAWRAARELFSCLPQAPGVAAAPEQALAAFAVLVPGIREHFPQLPQVPPDEPALVDAVRRILEDVAAEVPIVAFLDDAPVADEPSRRLILTLLRHPPAGVLLLLTGRIDDWEQVVTAAELQALPAVRSLRLRWLDRGEVEALLASAIELRPADRAELAQRLHAESRGNPFYAIELLRALVEEGRLEPDPTGVWNLSADLSAREFPLPTSLRDVVTGRLDRLSPAAREAREAAAVLGIPFDVEFLRRVARLSPIGAEAVLGELILHRLVQETGADAGRFEFAHELVRRQVAKALPARRGEELSRRAVQALEAGAATDEAARAALTHHRARIASGRPPSDAAACGGCRQVVRLRSPRLLRSHWRFGPLRGSAAKRRSASGAGPRRAAGRRRAGRRIRRSDRHPDRCRDLPGRRHRRGGRTGPCGGGGLPAGRVVPAAGPRQRRRDPRGSCSS
jgi:predicted ATPase